ncbi:beta-hexosaminidase [Physcia stellaris]|nr:beta-hexosaminidase [Physcia stellaris]
MSIWPLPWEFRKGSKPLWFPKSKDVPPLIYTPIIARDKIPWLENLLDEVNSDAINERVTVDPEEFIKCAYERFVCAITVQNFVPRKFHPRGEFSEPKAGNKPYVKKVVVEEYRSSEFGQYSEAYTLEVSEDGDILVRTISYRGCLLALRSLEQLFYAHTVSVDPYTPCAPITIRDCPVFGHRGLLLDISRNQILPNDVLNTIEALSLNKFNRLHLHATDSQSWPLEIPALPELARKGAYDERQIWHTSDLLDIQNYGLLRGIEVYIEVDLPSHAAAIGHAYPELITGHNAQPWHKYALEPPAGQLKLNSPEVSTFLATLLNDLLPRTSIFSSHFHFGGDELNREIYNLDPTVKSSSPDVLRPLLQKFFDHVLSVAKPYSQTPVLYEDVLLEWGLDFPKSAIFQSWRSHESFTAILKKGHKALFGPASHWYLDQGYGSWLDPDPENPDTVVKPPFLDWASPYKNWRQIYSYDPFADVSEEQKHLIAGGEACLWGELTDGVNLEQKLWPRTAAAGEILWKGPMKLEESTTRRLAEMRERLVAKGLRAEMVQMEWSLRNEGCSRM